MDKITYKDFESNFSILYDNNTWKCICKIDLNGAKKKLFVFNSEKKLNKYEISNIDDLYTYKDQIIESAKRFI